MRWTSDSYRRREFRLVFCPLLLICSFTTKQRFSDCVEIHSDGNFNAFFGSVFHQFPYLLGSLPSWNSLHFVAVVVQWEIVWKKVVASPSRWHFLWPTLLHYEPVMRQTRPTKCTFPFPASLGELKLIYATNKAKCLMAEIVDGCCWPRCCCCWWLWQYLHCRCLCIHIFTAGSWLYAFCYCLHTIQKLLRNIFYGLYSGAPWRYVCFRLLI